MTFKKSFSILMVAFTIVQNPVQCSSGIRLNQVDETPGICKTSECDLTANTVLNYMDTTVDPCEDFYRFSCGGWEEKYPIPASQSSWNQFSAIDENMNAEIRNILEIESNSTDPKPVLLAQQLYKMCISQDNKDNHTELRDLVETMVDGAANRIESDNLGVITGRIRRELDGDYLLKLYVYFDEKRPTQNIIYIDQPTFGLAIPHWLDKNDNKFVMAYEQLIADTWPFVFPEYSRNSTEIAKDVIVFERQLAQISTRMEERRNRSTNYNPMTVKELVDMLPQEIHLTEYFEEVFAETGLGIQWENVTIIAEDIPYFQALGAVLSNTSDSVIRDYLKWRIIFSFGNQVSSQFQDRTFEYQKVTSGIEAPEPKWKECSEWVNNYLGWAVSYRYIRSPSFRKDFKNEVSTIVEDIREGFQDILKEAEWIGNETKRVAFEKAEAMRSFVAYPEWLLNDLQALNKEFDGLLTQEFEKNHFNNYIRVGKWNNKKGLKELYKEKDYNKWLTYSSVVNAYYSASYNAIAFPAGILQVPFYGFPLQSMNYGAIGSVIGHEISHAFDDEGAQSDATGRLVNWWDDDTFSEYQKKAQCFIEQYGNFSVPELNNTLLNGINTQGENIADNGGLRQAFRGYQAYVKRNGEEKKLPGLDFTPDQLFFVAFAQSLCGSYRLEKLQNYVLTNRHSPLKFQVQGSIANSVDFANIWQCPVPTDPCQIW